MKVGKGGEVILSRSDRRVGNFVFSDYSDRVAFRDIGGVVRTSVSKTTLIGQMLSDAVKGGRDRFLHNYAGYLYYVNGITPDQEYLEYVIKGAEACIKRHPDLYGGLEGDDDKIVEEERELRGFEDAVKSIPDGE